MTRSLILPAGTTHKTLGRTTSPEAAFSVFLAVTAVMILRPGEVIGGLASLPIYEGLILAAIALSWPRMKRHLTRRSLIQEPITLCVIGVLCAVVLSHLTHFYLYGLRTSTVEFLKTLVYYLVLVSVVDTPDRLNRFLRWVAIVSTVMIAMCVVDYVGLIDFEFVKHTAEFDGVTATNMENRIQRMNGTGIFSDPNDISLLIVATGIVCASFMMDRARGPLRFVWGMPLSLLVVALLCTRSRGGLLAAGAGAFVWCVLRYGRKVGFAMIAAGLCVLPLIAGRQSSIDLNSGTGNERIRLWRDGYSAVLSANLPFGIGHDQYSEVAGLVAHNSFVHSFVELGLFGGTFFFGCFFFAAVAMYRLRTPALARFAPELARLRPCIAAMVAGWMIGLMSLSRCYVVPTYMIFGIAASYFNCVRRAVYPPTPVVCWDRRQVYRLCFASMGLFTALYLVVRLFA